MGVETRRRMLEPFFTTKVAGRGLGLAAVHGILRAHRGALSVTSEIGRGTTVHVFLPVPSSSSARPSGAGERSADVPAGRPRQHTILIVDDEPLVREVAEVFLQSEGFSVVTARDGREAHHVIDSRDDIGAVILDLSLPDVGVEEILDYVRDRRPGVPVILSSGHYEELADRGRQRDVVAFLLKPWELSRLLAVVDQALSRKSEI